MNSVTLNAYAKINLFLEVLDKRPDGYHNIDSIMQSVTLSDIVTVSECDEIILTNDAGLPNDINNLAYKAAVAFFEYTGLKKGARIHIEKHIPVSAGLAGGSTDAGAVLRALDNIYGSGLGVDTLCAIGSKLGADIPFCIKGGTMITRGIGNLFTECPSMPFCYIVISKKGEGVSTPYAYGEIDKMRNGRLNTYRSSEAVSGALANGMLFSLSDNIYNVFEEVVCPIRPFVNEQKAIMNKNNALCSLMSGSGPSVFGVFLREEDAMTALFDLKAYGAVAEICTPKK